MGVVGGNGCEVQRRGERANEFGLERQQAFLSFFAESCNIKASAKKARVSASTIYKRRRDDPEFRAAFAAAQDHATPMAMLFENGKAGLAGRFPELEQELCHLTTSGYQGKGSPDRADAMVWALTELSGRRSAPGVRGFVPA